MVPPVVLICGLSPTKGIPAPLTAGLSGTENDTVSCTVTVPSLDAMVDALLSIPAKRHVVVAGEMLELGPDAPTLHSNCGYRMAQRGVDVLLGVRGNARAMVSGASSSNAMDASFVDSAEAAGAWMAANLREGDAVLVKASRGVKLERALAALV